MENSRLVVRVKRFNPERKEYFLSFFEVKRENIVTVLDLLFFIKNHCDPSLSFQFGCRFKRCGLCAVEVDGKPVLSCAFRIPENKTELEISPLKNLSPIKDLVVDRKPSLSALKRLSAYPLNGEALDLGNASKLFLQLLECRECMACVSQCPVATPEKPLPFLFVKLALLKLHPGDNGNRTSQARELGIYECASCGRCYCPFGVPIRAAIKVLSDGEY